MDMPTLNPFTVTTTIRLHDNDVWQNYVLSGLGVVSITTIESRCKTIHEVVSYTSSWVVVHTGG